MGLGLTTTASVLLAINDEVRRQDDKWGENRNLPNGLWLGVLTEEVGEVSRALLEQEGVFAFDNATAQEVEDELIQVAAVALQWVKCLRRHRAVMELLTRKPE